MDSLPSGTPWRAAPQGTRRNDLQTWEAEDAHHVCQVLTASIVGASSGDYLFVAPIQNAFARKGATADVRGKAHGTA